LSRILDTRVRTVLAELESWGLENDRTQTDRSRKMLNLERKTAEIVSSLIVGAKAKRVLEIGTSNGYSTIWLAASVGPRGRVISIDRNPEKQRLAKENLERAGLLDRTELLLGNATEIVAGREGPFDAVFFDADRFSAPEQLALLVPKLSPKALLLADNALSHPDEIAGYLAAIQVLPDFKHEVIPVGKGLSVASRLA
jgi:predicted O-methyltransferase YrrM